MTISSLKTNDKFYRFLDNKENIPALRKKTLPNLLMLPFERIGEYYEFFRQLQLHTNDRHKDFERVEQCYTKIDLLNTFMRRYQSKYENMTSLLRIQMRIHGDFESFVEAGRFWVYEGEVTFEGGTRFSSAVQYNLFLFNDMLLWTSLKGIYIDSCEFLDSTFEFGPSQDSDTKFWFGLHGQKQIVTCSSVNRRSDWLQMISRHRTRVLKEKSKMQQRKANTNIASRAHRTGSIGTRSHRTGSVVSRSSVASSFHSLTSPRRNNDLSPYSRSHRSSVASSHSQGGYRYDRSNSGFGSVHSFDTHSQHSGFGGSQHNSRVNRQRAPSEYSDRSAGRRSVASNNSRASRNKLLQNNALSPRNALNAQAQQRGVSGSVSNFSVGGLGNTTGYAPSIHSQTSDANDSIILKGKLDYNNKVLQKAHQRLEKAHQKIIKLQEDKEALKKLNKDLQDSNRSYRSQNESLKKDKKYLEREIKKYKKRLRDQGPPMSSSSGAGSGAGSSNRKKKSN